MSRIAAALLSFTASNFVYTSHNNVLLFKMLLCTSPAFTRDDKDDICFQRSFGARGLRPRLLRMTKGKAALALDDKDEKIFFDAVQNFTFYILHFTFIKEILRRFAPQDDRGERGRVARPQDDRGAGAHSAPTLPTGTENFDRRSTRTLRLKIRRRR